MDNVPKTLLLQELWHHFLYLHTAFHPAALPLCISFFAYLKHFHYFCVNIKSPQLYQTQIPKSANMKKHFFFFLFLISSFLAAAQTYNYIGVEDGLSNRRVYAIQKGPKGYMWFLTHDGIDRYNGKEFKHYKLMDGEDEINSMMNLNWLYSDSQGRLWEIGKQGRVFCYESKHDRFQLVYKLPKSRDGRPAHSRQLWIYR